MIMVFQSASYKLRSAKDDLSRFVDPFHAVGYFLLESSCERSQQPESFSSPHNGVRGPAGSAGACQESGANFTCCTVA